MPIIQQTRPALEVPKLDAEYNSGESWYNFLSLLANINPMIPQIKPTMP